MSVTELPKFGEPRIADGTFVIFSFDPAAYASFLDPEDELLSAAASQIKRKKYLGLVEGVGPIDLPRLRQNLDVRVVGLAPPQEGEDDVYPTNPTRCNPIYPCTNHPDGREPLTPSVPLPWPEAYVHTLQLVNAYISRVHHSKTEKATVTKDEMRRLGKCVVKDQYAAADERRASEPVDADMDQDDGSDESVSDEDYGSGSEASCESEVRAPPDVYMEIWEDLAVASHLGEPKDVGGDFDEVAGLGEEWARRKNEERCTSESKTLEWAARVAEMGHESYESDVEGDVPGGYESDGSDDLSPEDAIDERVKPSAGHVGDSVDDNRPSSNAVGTTRTETYATADVGREGIGSQVFGFLAGWVRLAMHL